MQKNKQRMLAIVAAALVAVLAVVYWAVDNTVPSAERKALYYKNPMGTGHVSDKPMKDEMGMDYVPVYTDTIPEEVNVVRVDPGVIQNIGVRTESVASGPVGGEVHLNGVLALDETRVRTVATRVSGYIVKLHVSGVGQAVREDSPLYEIQSQELLTMVEELHAAVRYQQSLSVQTNALQLKSATELTAAARSRLRATGLSIREIDALQERGETPRSVVIRATHKGVLIKKNVVEGAHVAAATELFTFADLSSLWILVDVYEQDLAAVRVGSVAEVEVQGLPGETFRSRVEFVYPTLDNQSRTVKARLALPNSQGLLKPDMYARVTIRDARPRVGLRLPKSAVLRGGKQDLVIVALGEGRFRPQAVRLGIETREYFVALDGVAEGDTVVTSAQFLLDSESRVQEAVEKMRAGNDTGNAH